MVAAAFTCPTLALAQTAPTEVAELLAGIGTSSVGWSVALCRDVALVGAGKSAHVFERDAGGPGAWGLTRNLVSPNGSGTGFGGSVALDDRVAVVGASATNGFLGAAHVFGRDAGGPGAWGLLANLHAPDEYRQRYFGSAVAVAGPLIVVSAPSSPYVGTGVAYVFVFERVEPTPEWTWVQTLTSGRRFDTFGSSLAIHGDTIVVGASWSNLLGLASGAAYVFERGPDGTWGEGLLLMDPGGAAFDSFGHSVDIADDVIVVGADSNAGSGSAYIYEHLDDEWRMVRKHSGTYGDRFGFAVAVDGKTVLVGAVREDKPTNSGAAYVFQRHLGGPSHWGPLRPELRAHDPKKGDGFGRFVALSGNSLLVGAPFHEHSGSAPGAAYVFDGL